MPNIASSIRQVRTDERRTERNKSARTEVKSIITKAEKLIAAGKMDEAKVAVKTAAKTLDKAANKGVLHSNNTSRRKARLVAKLNNATKK
ncbi:MAG: 30S ribosomal protein S20 [Dehalococcoidales bacterium]|nr:30S ribosomal protein S20 [Dehalococcoidales bacterium]